MDGVVDIYIKLVIAVIGFITPMAVYILKEAIDKKKDLREALPILNEQVRNLISAAQPYDKSVDQLLKEADENLTVKEFNEQRASLTGDKQTELKEELNKSRKNLMLTHRLIHFMNLDKRATEIFAALLISLACCMLYNVFLDKDKEFTILSNLYLPYKPVDLLFIFFAFIYVIIRIDTFNKEFETLHEQKRLGKCVLNLLDCTVVGMFLFFLFALLHSMNVIGISSSRVLAYLSLIASLVYFIFALIKIRNIFITSNYVKSLEIHKKDGAAIPEWFKTEKL